MERQKDCKKNGKKEEIQKMKVGRKEYNKMERNLKLLNSNEIKEYKERK